MMTTDEMAVWLMAFGCASAMMRSKTDADTCRLGAVRVAKRAVRDFRKMVEPTANRGERPSGVRLSEQIAMSVFTGDNVAADADVDLAVAAPLAV